MFLSFPVFAEAKFDQWQDSNKTYYDLVQEEFEVKGYDITNIEVQNGYIFMFFVTVLQKNNEVYECQEYQTLDSNMQIINLTKNALKFTPKGCIKIKATYDYSQN